MRKASATKTKFGYKATIIREDGSTLRASKCHNTREEAIASAQLWIEQIESNVNRPRPEKVNPYLEFLKKNNP